MDYAHLAAETRVEAEGIRQDGVEGLKAKDVADAFDTLAAAIEDLQRTLDAMS